MKPPPLIPIYWSAEEALAVFEFIDELREAIWSRYGLAITEQLREERSTDPDDGESAFSGEGGRWETAEDDDPF
jgi:hypothetical protein